MILYFIIILVNYFQAEREAKYAMKKELDSRINSESMYNLSNLAFSIRGKDTFCVEAHLQTLLDNQLKVTSYNSFF